MLASGQWPVMMKMPFPMMISWRIDVVRKPNFQRECTVLVLPESRSSSRWWQSRARASWGTSPTSFWLRSETGKLLPETVKKKFEFSGEKTNHKGEDFVFLCGSGIGNRLEREGGCGCRVPNSTGNKCGAVPNFFYSFVRIHCNCLGFCPPIASWSFQSDSSGILSVQKIALFALNPSCPLHLSTLCSYLVQNSSVSCFFPLTKFVLHIISFLCGISASNLFSKLRSLNPYKGRDLSPYHQV